MLADALGRPLRFLITPGQAGGAILADKAYDSNALRAIIAEMNAQVVIPSNRSRKVILPLNATLWVRVVNEVTRAVFEQEITADLPANTQFLSPRLYHNTGATAAVAYDSAGLYLETDY